MKDEPDLALLVCPAQPEQGAVTNELPGRGQLGGQAERLAVGRQGAGRHLPLQQDADLRPVPGLVIQVAGDLGQPMELVQGVEVVRRERPEREPWRADRVVGLEHGCCPLGRAPGRPPGGLWRTAGTVAAGGGPRARRGRARPRGVTDTGRAPERSSQRSAPPPGPPPPPRPFPPPPPPARPTP